MTRNIPLIAVVIIGILTLTGLIFFTFSPIMHSQVNASAQTRYHVNTGLLKSGPINSTTDVIPLMQTLLDLSESITHDIRVRDPDRARSDLVTYNLTSRELENLVYSQDMQASDIGRFTSSISTQYGILLQLGDGTATLDTLKNRESRSLSSRDPDMLFWIDNRADSLQKRMDALFTGYVNEQAKIQPIDTKLGLETTEYNQSTFEFQNITTDADSFANTISLGGNVISEGLNPTIDIEPAQATYGDTFFVFGHLGSAGTAGGADIYIDNILLQHFTPDANGNYIGSYTVEKIRPGAHIFIAKASGMNSTPAVLTILLTNSTTFLNAQPNAKGSAVICSGALATNQPLMFVPFTIFDSNLPVYYGTTDRNGEFNVSVPLSPGTHSLSAVFNSVAYPVNPSKSTMVTVNNPAPLNPFVGIVTIIVAILVASLGGAFLYLRRKKTLVPAGRGPVHPLPVPGIPPGSELPVLPIPESAPDDILTPDIMWVTEPVVSGEMDVPQPQGISEEANLAYRTLVRCLAKNYHIDRYLTQTPLEIASKCQDGPDWVTLFRFISAYEKIRYAGGRSEEDWHEFQESLEQADKNIRGDHD